MNGKPVRLSITLNALDGARPLRELGDVARAADDAGLDTVWVPDHLMEVTPGRAVTDPVLEAYTLLGFLAGQTSRVRLGTMVSAVTFRPAALLVKAVTTLDVLSGGRAWLGVGAGYQQDEADALGLPLPPTRERFTLLEETVDLALRLWAGDRDAYRGQALDLSAPVASPGPVSRPHPPVLIGGTGARRTLPLVARYADAANVFDIPDGGAAMRTALETLDRCCEDIGREPSSIERTVNSMLGDDETPATTAARCERLGEAGADHVILLSPRPWTTAAISRLAGVR